MSEVSPALREGIVAAQAHQFDRARVLLEQATAETPADPIAWFWMAIASPSAEAALPPLRRVLELDPSHEQARAALARLLQSEANRLAAGSGRKEARVLAAEATQVAPGVQKTWLTLAALTDDQKERLDALRQALSLTPDDVALQTRLRQALLARGVMPSTDRADARACFREAAGLGADDPRVWQALAKLADTTAERVDALRRLIAVAPDHAGAKQALRQALVDDARFLTSDQRLEEACAQWKEALALPGDAIEAWLGIAETTADRDEATSAVEAAYKLKPSDERAIAAMRRLNALKIDPAKMAAPIDAFARFGDSHSDAAPASGVEIELEVDSSLDAFANLEDTPAPVAAAPVAAAPVAAAPIVAPPAPVPVPAPAPATPAAAAAATPAPAAAAPANGTKRTVMVVDDSPTIRKILGLTLERAGYQVVAEPDGEAAIERLVQLVPDLILLDIAMPKIDGYEVCKRIKQDPRTASVPVVMLSGKGAMFDKVKGHMAGATEYLTKPFETPAVLAVVTNYCEQPAEAVHG